jgi:GcrA cell cycle regulator
LSFEPNIPQRYGARRQLVDWNDENVATLKRLWAAGFSASQIATRIPGANRQCVIGKVHRLGLSGRITTVRTKRSGANKNRRALKRRMWAAAKSPLQPSLPRFDPVPFTSEPDLVIPPGERKTLAELEAADCRWGIGHVGEAEFHFCGRPRANGLPYCEYHCRRAYQAAIPQRFTFGPALQRLETIDG